MRLLCPIDHADTAAACTQDLGGTEGVLRIVVADGEVVAVVRDGGRECAALEPEVAIDGDRLAAAPVAVGAADEHERRIAADVDRAVTHRQLHRLDVAQDAVAVLGHHDVDADRVAGIALRHAQHEGFRPGDLRHIDRVRQVIVSRFAVAAEILAVLRDEHALGEHGLRARRPAAYGLCSRARSRRDRQSRIRARR